MFDIALVREMFSELCHNQWVGWMEYLFSKCTLQPNGSIVIPEWAVERWQRQMGTEYRNLSEDEKVSDRECADEFLYVLEKLR